MVGEFDGSVRYVDENFGDSELAERFGITQYPAVFVDDVLMATPRDFHPWDDDEGGRYVPWRDEASHRRFQADLRTVVERRLRGEDVASAEVDGGIQAAPELPTLTLQTLEGEVRTATLRGRPVLVEAWATWCPPCLSTLAWLDELTESGLDVEVLALAVASEEAAVRKMVADRGFGATVVLADDALLEHFGAVTTVPTLFVYDQEGKLAEVFYGAPADLHQRVEALLRRLGGP